MNKLLPNKVNHNIDIELDPHPEAYTNGDLISGSVTLHTSSQTEAALISVNLTGICVTMLEDASSTPTFEGHGESHVILSKSHVLFPTPDLGNSSTAYTFPQGDHQYRFEFQLPKDDFNLQCIDNGEFLHKRGYIKDNMIVPPVTLPPSLLYEKGIHHYARIEYSIDVVIQKTPNSKQVVEKKQVFTFLPKLNLVTFNGSKIHGANISGKGFEFKYKTLENEDSKFKSILKKALPASKVGLNFELQASFVDHLEPYNSLYRSPRIIQNGDDLSEILKLSILTTHSYDELIKKVFGSTPHESEMIILQSLKIKLVSYLIFKSQIFSDTRPFKTVLVDNPELNYVINHEDFQNIGSVSPIDTKKSSDSENQIFSKASGGEFYKFELPPEIYSGTVTSLLPSFVTCNLKMEHKLHITAKFKSSWNPNLESTVRLRPSVVFLKDFHQQKLRSDWESLPVYSPEEDDSDY